MKISIVIPAYNEEKLLPKTLQSIEKLKRQPDEVLIIDGDSTDKTTHIAVEWGARVVVVKHRGIGFARQKGLEEARGDIIATTDADTVLPPGWLTTIEDALETPGVVGVYSGYKVPDGWLPYRVFINYLHPFTFWLSQYIGPPIAPGQNTSFYKDKALAVGGYPTTFKAAEDIEMMRRLKKIGKVKYLPNNYVVSSGRRGDEGWPLIWRMSKGLFTYYITKKADTFDFPDVR